MAGSVRAPSTSENRSRRAGADSTGRPGRDADHRDPVSPRPSARDAGLAVRDDGRHPRARRGVRQPAATGRTRAVRVVPRPGGRADRRDRVPAQDRLAVSAVPRDRCVPGARHHARADGRGLAGPVARRARVHREMRRADRHPDRHPRSARGRSGDGRAAPRRGLGHGGLSRRRRDERGRRARSAQPRRGLQGAVRVLRAEQPVGDLRSGQPPAGGTVDRAPRDRLRDARHPGRRQRRAGLLRGDGRGRRSAPARAAARR